MNFFGISFYLKKFFDSKYDKGLMVKCHHWWLGSNSTGLETISTRIGWKIVFNELESVT